MDIDKIIPIHTQEEINPIEPKDYKGEDGMIYCGVCGKPKQHRFRAMNTERIVPCICDCRKAEQRKREEEIRKQDEAAMIQRIKVSSLISGRFKNARFDSYIIREENKNAFNMAKAYCEDWQKMKEKNWGILFWGNVGTGKSFTAACIANDLMERGITVKMTSFVRILEDIQPSSNTNIKEYMEALLSPELLIIDDLGAERDTSYAQEKVYSVIDGRIQKNLPMILTTNLTMNELKTCTDLQCRRIYDRVFDVCHPVLLAGQSFRIERANDRWKQMQGMMNGRKQA